jgi:hypothetical protein
MAELLKTVVLINFWWYYCINKMPAVSICYVPFQNLSNSGMGWPSKSRKFGLGWGKTTEHLEAQRFVFVAGGNTRTYAPSLCASLEERAGHVCVCVCFFYVQQLYGIVPVFLS